MMTCYQPVAGELLDKFVSRRVTRKPPGMNVVFLISDLSLLLAL